MIDVSGNSLNQSPVVLYSDGRNDVSDEILAMLNANVPAEFKDAIKPASKP